MEHVANLIHDSLSNEVNFPSIRGAYFLKLPAPIISNKKLLSNDKILLSLINCLSRKMGYCWATNSYLSGILKIKKATVSRKLHKLQTLEVINIRYLGKHRCIYPCCTQSDSFLIKTNKCYTKLVDS